MGYLNKKDFVLFLEYLQSISEAQVTWLAGLLEGEGAFMLCNSKSARNGTMYKTPRIAVSMTDEDVILRVCAMFRTKCSPVPIPTHGNLPQFRAMVSGRNAIEFMKLLLPHMGNRRSNKIKEILLRFSEYKDPNVRRREWSQVAAAKRDRNNKGQLI